MKSKSDRCSMCAANDAISAFPSSSISPNAYWSSMCENKDRASDSGIHPRSPTGKAPSDADSAALVLALSLRASGGRRAPEPSKDLIVFHIFTRHQAPSPSRSIAGLDALNHLLSFRGALATFGGLASVPLPAAARIAALATFGASRLRRNGARALVVDRWITSWPSSRG